MLSSRRCSSSSSLAVMRLREVTRINQRGQRERKVAKHVEEGKAFKVDTLWKLYIKIPEVPIRVSYKGNKEKNIEDINNFSLILPTIEYHNQTWTWLDFLMAIKNESRRTLLSQAVRQKLHIKPGFLSSKEKAGEDSSIGTCSVAQEEEEDVEKARMLLGDLGPGKVSQGKSKFSLFKKSN